MNFTTHLALGLAVTTVAVITVAAAIAAMRRGVGEPPLDALQQTAPRPMDALEADIAHAGQRRPQRFSDRGSVTAEMAVFAIPVLVLLAMFIVFCGRAASAAIDVRAIAAAAARAAADAPTAAQAPDAASLAAAAMASGTKWSCTAATDSTQFYRGGTVVVAVTCQVRLGDLGITGLQDAKVVAATAIQPVDTYRTGP